MTQKSSLVMKTITLKFSLAILVLRIPAQLEQEISGKVLGVLFTPYSWQ